MRFEKNPRNFNSRFSRSVTRKAPQRSEVGGKFGGLIRDTYSNYMNSMSKSSSNPKEKIVLLGLSILTAGMMVLLFSTIVISMFLPSTKNVENLLKVESTIFFDRKGQALYTVHGEENRVVVKSEDIPEVVKKAAVAIEDSSFYKHKGFDLPAIAKAVLSEIGFGRRRGGSTITQQFVKNAILSNERTYIRKFKEIILATRIERNYTKDEILTMYLNKIPYGGTAYGVQKASEVFFNKKVNELKLPEAVILAALPQGPSYYSPFGAHKYTTLNTEFSVEDLAKKKVKSVGDLNSKDFDIGLIGKYYDLADGSSLYLPGRTDEVLKRMYDLGYIKKSEREEALKEVQNYVFNDYVASIKAPHFVFYVRELLEKTYGKDLVENGGLRVYTTLDYDLYEESRKVLAAQVASNSKNYKAHNAAALTVDPSTGEILSMVGSADYNNADIDGSVNMTTAVRQPGSSYKPIVYAGSFMNGYGPGTVIYDVPTRFDSDTPKNYDGGFVGPISIRKALGNSRNIPAIKAYYLAGEQDSIISLSESMGFTTLDRRRDYGWPLALGSGEVKMTDMVQAFGVFANGGQRVDLNPILRIEDNTGKILVDNTNVVPKSTKVLSPQVAYLINDILSDRSVNLGGRLNLPDGRTVAVKTGTSTKKVGDTSFPRDLWSVGYTPQRVTAVWAGNSDGEEMVLGADGYNAAVPIWNEIMMLSLKNLSKVEFEKPERIVNVRLSRLSGKLPMDGTPEHLITNDIFAAESAPKEVDNSFERIKVDTRNNKLPNAYCPEGVVEEIAFYNPKPVIEGRFNWQAEILEWFKGLDAEKLKELNLGEKVLVGGVIHEESELCNPAFANNKLEIRISNLVDGQKLPNGLFDVATEVVADAGVDRVEFYLDGELKASDNMHPFVGQVRVPVGFKKGHKFDIEVKVFDKNQYTRSAKMQFVTDPDVGLEYKGEESENSRDVSDSEASGEPEVVLPEIDSTIEFTME